MSGPGAARRAVPAGAVSAMLAAVAMAACTGGGQLRHTFEIAEQDGVPVAVSSVIPRPDGSRGGG